MGRHPDDAAGRRRRAPRHLGRQPTDRSRSPSTDPRADSRTSSSYDVIKLKNGNVAELDHLLRYTVSTVIAIDRTLRPDLGIRARDKGVEWAITLDISPTSLSP